MPPTTSPFRELKVLATLAIRATDKPPTKPLQMKQNPNQTIIKHPKRTTHKPLETKHDQNRTTTRTPQFAQLMNRLKNPPVRNCCSATRCYFTLCGVCVGFHFLIGNSSAKLRRFVMVCWVSAFRNDCCCLWWFARIGSGWV